MSEEQEPTAQEVMERIRLRREAIPRLETELRESEAREAKLRERLAGIPPVRAWLVPVAVGMATGMAIMAGINNPGERVETGDVYIDQFGRDDDNLTRCIIAAVSETGVTLQCAKTDSYGNPEMRPTSYEYLASRYRLAP